MNEIKAHFDTNFGKPFVLRGMGGIGKTSIALEYAYRCRDSGMMVLWVDATSHQSLIAAFRRIVKNTMNTELEGNDDMSGYDYDIRSLGIESMEKKRNWLMVFDNADDETIPFGDWVPRNGKVLFTTRDERLAYKINALMKELQVMNDQEATALFAVGNSLQSNSTLPPDLVSRLIRRLGNLPLAISLASAYLREYSTISLSTYLQSLEDFDNRIELLAYKEAFSNYNHSVLSTWEISFQRVQRDNPRAATIMTLLGFLANNQITMKFLVRFSEFHQAEVAEQLEFLGNPLLVAQALGLLKSLALINEEAGNISLHPLVHEWAQARHSQPEMARYAIFALIFLAGRYLFYKYPESSQIINCLEDDVAEPMFWNHVKVCWTPAVRLRHSLTMVDNGLYLFLLTMITMIGEKTPSITQGQPSPPPYQPSAFGEALKSEDANPWYATASEFLQIVRPESRSALELCTLVAENIVNFRHARYRNWNMFRGNSFDDVDIEPAILEAACHEYVRHLEAILHAVQKLQSMQLPDDILDVLYIWTSAMAEICGHAIPVTLQKPLCEPGALLFYEAFCLGKKFRSFNSQKLTLKGSMSFARYIDLQACHGDVWRKVEESLLHCLPVAIETLGGPSFAGYLDYLCQSLWESDHEDALYGLVHLAQAKDQRISNKWKLRVEDRWKELRRSRRAFKGLPEEERRIAVTLLRTFNFFSNEI